MWIAFIIDTYKDSLGTEPLKKDSSHPKRVGPHPLHRAFGVLFGCIVFLSFFLLYVHLCEPFPAVQQVFYILSLLIKLYIFYKYNFIFSSSIILTKLLVFHKFGKHTWPKKPLCFCIGRHKSFLFSISLGCWSVY